MEWTRTSLLHAKRWEAIGMTQRVIGELERQRRHRRESLEIVLEPEIDRIDTLARASERLVADDPERWQGLASLYGELGDLLRAEASELEEEIAIHEALLEALREDLVELESLAARTGPGRA